MISTPNPVFFWWSNREEWDGRGMLHVWGLKRYIQGFGGEIWVKETILEDQA